MRSDPYAQGLALAADNRHFEAIECFEKALAQDPNDTRVLFALGNTAAALGMAKPAETLFRQVLALEPGRLEALINLANLLRAEGQFGAAEALLAPALARNTASPDLWLTLGSVFREKGDPIRAAAFYREALQHRPDYPPALGNLADILADDGNVEEALALYGRVLAAEPANAQARLNRAVLHLLTGDLPQGWRDYEARQQVPGKSPQADRAIPEWNGTALTKTRLLVRAEQGVGDQIMFTSLVPELARRAEAEDGTIFLECEPRLETLFQRSFPNVTVMPSRIEKRGANLVANYDGLSVDAAILLGSLPRSIRDTLARFPNPHRYLKADPNEQSRWREFFQATGAGPTIGVCWRSGARGGGRAVQYAPLDAWASFLRDLSATIVVAQYDATDEEVRELERHSGKTLVRPPALDQKNELDRTCAMLAALDACVSAPTAVSWLAAGAGVPTFKILYDTSWTSFGCAYEPFAPSAELMMPNTRGDWADNFAQASRRISALPVRG